MNCRVALVLALLLGLAGRAPAQGGTAPKLLYACYLPQSGVVYRVGETDLKSQTPQCASTNHVLFSWNAKGDKGDQGVKGEPGNLALGGQVCPAGQFIAGFSATGALICGAPTTGGGGVPPSQYEGTWLFNPLLGATCNAAGQDLLSLRSLTVETRVSTENGITFGLHLDLAPNSTPFILDIPSSFDAVAGTFSGSESFERGVSTSLSVSGHVTINGAFVGTNSFTATINLSIQGFLVATAFTCNPIVETVIGTRQ